MTVLELLNWSTRYLKDHRIENPRLNAELLLARSLNLSREGLYAHLHDQAKEGEEGDLEKLIQRRISGEPLQYILGHQEFWSIDFKVDPRVLIPRPETELLVEQSLLILSETSFQTNSFCSRNRNGKRCDRHCLGERDEKYLFGSDRYLQRALLLSKGKCEICRRLRIRSSL